MKMNEAGDKQADHKISIINTLMILYKYTDEQHPMSRDKICTKLREDFDINVNPKTVRRNIQKLIESGYEIGYTEIDRTLSDENGEKRESNIWTDFYMKQRPTDKGEDSAETSADTDGSLVGVFSERERNLIFEALVKSAVMDYSTLRTIVTELDSLFHTNLESDYLRYVYVKNRTVSACSQRERDNFKMICDARREKRTISFSYGDKDPDDFYMIDLNGINMSFPEINVADLIPVPGVSGAFKCWVDKNRKHTFTPPCEIEEMDNLFPYAIRIKGNAYYFDAGGRLFRLDKIWKLKLNDVIDTGEAVLYDDQIIILDWLWPR